MQEVVEPEIDQELLKVSDHRSKGDATYYDDITGQVLDPLLVQ